MTSVEKSFNYLPKLKISLLKYIWNICNYNDFTIIKSEGKTQELLAHTISNQI